MELCIICWYFPFDFAEVSYLVFFLFIGRQDYVSKGSPVVSILVELAIVVSSVCFSVGSEEGDQGLYSVGQEG